MKLNIKKYDIIKIKDKSNICSWIQWIKKIKYTSPGINIWAIDEIYIGIQTGENLENNGQSVELSLPLKDYKITILKRNASKKDWEEYKIIYKII